MIDAVRGCPLFFELHANEIEAVLRDAVVVSFDPGTFVLQEGDPSNELYVILHGSVEVSKQVDGHPVIVDQIQRGNVFGETALLDEGKRNNSIRTVNKCDILVIQREAIFSLYKKRRDTFSVLMLNLCRILTQRLGQYSEEVSRYRDSGRLVVGG